LKTMGIRLSPYQEARLAALAARTGLSPDDVVEEALALWEAHQALRRHPGRTPAQAAARILELRKGNTLPEGETIKDLINYGRA
jgi:predicted transcriptional regulator